MKAATTSAPTRPSPSGMVNFIERSPGFKSKRIRVAAWRSARADATPRTDPRDVAIRNSISAYAIGSPSRPTTKRSQASSRSSRTHADSHHAAGWKNINASIKRCTIFTRLSQRLTWASSCNSTISSSLGVQPVRAADGSRISGRITPIKIGPANRSQTPTETRRAILSEAANIRHRSSIALPAIRRLERLSRSTPIKPAASESKVKHEPAIQNQGNSATTG